MDVYHPLIDLFSKVNLPYPGGNKVNVNYGGAKFINNYSVEHGESPTIFINPPIMRCPNLFSFASAAPDITPEFFTLNKTPW